jgi:thiol-disulfide isomerase/thioredoxin
MQLLREEEPMITRRRAVAGLALSPFLTLAANAADKKPFDQAAFEAAQAQGKPVLVEVSASWCPVCKAQAPILATLRSDPRFKDLVSFDIDFDSQKDLLRKFSVTKQSTLIVFKGKQEVGRSTGDASPSSIESLLSKAI